MRDEIITERLRLVSMTPAFLQSTVAGNRPEAEALIGLSVPAEWFACASFAAFRLRQFEAGATSPPWLPRAVVLCSSGAMAGFVNFHTPPGPEYLRDLSPAGVEFGYTVFPEFRRQGIAWEATHALIDWAHRLHGVRAFVVSVSPANVASLSLTAKMGFRRIGSHLDEEDGPEDIFELIVNRPFGRTPPR